MSFKGCWGGVSNIPFKSDIPPPYKICTTRYYQILRGHSSELPALVEGPLCAIELGKRVGRILQPVAQGLRLCHSVPTFTVHRSRDFTLECTEVAC
jgi:hypothetical protein